MPNPGQTIETADHERIEFVHTADDTGGERLEMKVRFKPHSAPPPSHFHPRQDEEFEVLAGTFEVTVAGRTDTYRAGDTFRVPARALHSMHNAGDEFGELRWITRPALRSGELFERIWEVKRREASLGRLGAALVYVSVFADHRAEIVLTGLPRVLVTIRRVFNRVSRLILLLTVLIAVLLAVPLFALFALSTIRA